MLRTEFNVLHAFKMESVSEFNPCYGRLSSKELNEMYDNLPADQMEIFELRAQFHLRRASYLHNNITSLLQQIFG